MRGRGALAAPLAAALVYLAVTLVWSAHEAPKRGEAFAPGSVWSSRDDGWSLAFGYLAEQARRRGGPPVQVLDRPTPAAELPVDGVVFRVQPAGEDLEAVRAADEAWVAQGGRLVLVIDQPYRGFDPVAVAAGGRVSRTYPLGPDALRYRPIPPRGLGPGESPESSQTLGHTLYASGETPLAVRRQLGAGEIFVFASPESFANQGLGRADHLAILATLAPGDRPIFFDETSHGTARGSRVLALLASWGLGPALVALGLVALFALWRAATRIGPPEREPGEGRSEAVDLVDSLADLYGRALDRSDALALYAEGLERTVTVETGLRDEAARSRARQLAPAAYGLAGPKELGRNEFATALGQLNDAYDQVEHARHR